jgi:hypothetical protein
MERRPRRRWILAWTTTLVGVAWVASIGGLGAQGFPGADGDCRCVDDEGQAIRNCSCLRMPSFDWTMGSQQWNRARIGISVGWDQPPDDEAEGVRVQSVLEGGPADEAGLRQGDIVTHVGGRSVFDPLEDSEAEGRLDLDRSVPAQRLVALLRAFEPGEEVEIEYNRNGETDTVTLVAEPNWPEIAGMIGMPGAPSGNVTAPRFGLGSAWTEPRETRGFFGISRDPCFPQIVVPGDVSFHGDSCVDGVDLVELNPELAEYFGSSEGVLVTDVREGSALGLRPGDVILSVDGRAVTSPDHARRVLESYEFDEDLTLRILRHEEEMEVMGRRR